MSKRYTDQFRASAVVMLEAEGYPDRKGALMKISRYLQVPHSTLLRWYNRQNNPPPSELAHEKKADFVTLIRAEIEGILGEMPDARMDASFRDLGTVAGILLDKLQLLEGKPTEIARSEDWRSDAIRDIQAGKIRFKDLEDAFDRDLATQLFTEAGVSIQVG